jgi:hypothetical protein
MDVAWTEYLKYRAALRGYDLKGIESILKLSKERYVDTATNRHVVVGRCRGILVLIPYERGEGVMTPVTVHTTSRQQIEFRVKTGRLIHE